MTPLKRVFKYHYLQKKGRITRKDEARLEYNFLLKDLLTNLEGLKCIFFGMYLKTAVLFTVYTGQT